MSWITWLEARLGFLAIPRLIPMVAILNLLVYILHLFQPTYVRLLTLEPALVLHGQLWRLVSYIFIPDILFRYTSSGLQPLFLFFYLWFMWWIGDALEQAWGPFRLTLYYVIGMFGVTAAAFFLGAGQSQGNDTPFFLNLSLFFAFATLFPNLQIYVLFIVPLRVKWVALLSLAWILFPFLAGPVVVKVAILICLLNYLLFFGPAVIAGARQGREQQKRRIKFGASRGSPEEPLHRCAVCKRTERDGADLEFRTSSRDGNEYCLEHLPK
ncbi:MAG: hypothetical protein JO015_07035 [Verrucomicrobia bacterium]|nr:hypothetical protein [Verrucomicrobiota bacterium]